MPLLNIRIIFTRLIGICNRLKLKGKSWPSDFIFIFLLSFFFVPAVLADQSDLSLKWLLPKPTTGKEEIKIINRSNKDILLEGWQIDDIDGGSKPIALSGVIKAGGSLVIEPSAPMFNNAGDRLRLIKDGIVQEEIEYDQADVGMYWYKDEVDRWCWLDSQKLEDGPLCPAASPTPTAIPTPIPTAYIYPYAACLDLKIIKIYPSPQKGQQEMVMIYNPHQFEVDLSGYQIDDEPGHGRPIDLVGSIKANGVKEVILAKSILNNSGDQARLLCLSRVIDGLVYDRVDKGYLLVRDKTDKLCMLPYPFWRTDYQDIDCSVKNDLALLSYKQSPPVKPKSRSQPKSRGQVLASSVALLPKPQPFKVYNRPQGEPIKKATGLNTWLNLNLATVLIWRLVRQVLKQ